MPSDRQLPSHDRMTAEAMPTYAPSIWTAFLVSTLPCARCCLPGNSDNWRRSTLCGAPDDSRSHFQAMALMERGVENESGPASGWIGRHLATHNTGNLSPLRAVGFGNPLPRSLRGPVPVSAFKSIADFHLGGDERALAAMQSVLAAIYSGDSTASGLLQGQDEANLHQVGASTLAVVDLLGKLNPDQYRPSGAVVYPESDFGRALRQVAMLIKAEAGLEVAAVDVGGWDTHFVQGGSQGLMARLLADLGQGLAALHADLIDHADRLSVVVMSEFGRRLQENGSFGTDHGHGSLMLLLGGNLAGGQVHGRWPGLADELLVGPGDLAVTTDYRNVLAELCVRRLKNASVTEIFPGWGVQPVEVFGKDKVSSCSGRISGARPQSRWVLSFNIEL